MEKSDPYAELATAPEEVYLQAAEWLDVLADRPRDKVTARRFQNWLQQDPRHQWALERMSNTWSDPALAEASNKAVSSLSLAQRYRTASPGRRLVWSSLAAVACSAVVAVIVMVRPLQADKPDYMHAAIAVETPIAETRHLQLSDGTALEVNAGSSLSVHMNDDYRVVHLKRGATYFDVAPDKQRPFTVTINDASVVAVGTEFNIDKTSSGTDVTVHEGAIEVRANPSDIPTLVRAGERVRVYRTSVSEIQRVDLSGVVDWRTGWLEIDDESLVYLLEQVSRYSSKPIQLGNAELETLRVAGRFQLKQPQATLALLREFYDLETVEQKERILVYPASS